MTWSLADTTYGQNIARYLALDVNFGSRYLTANGIMEFEGNTAVNVTGTCFEPNGGVFCNVTLGNFTATLSIDANLAGIIRDFDASGSLDSTGTMALLSIQ